MRVNLVRFGIVIRALRRRRTWRQIDLGKASGVSQGTVSLIERGHGDTLAHRTLVRVAAALDAHVAIDVRWRGGELDRLVDRDHASVVAAASETLAATGWRVHVEITYSVYGQNGSIDLLAWHEPTHSLLVLEVKTEITSAEATIRRIDEKVRLAPRIAVERFGYDPKTVSRLLVVEASTTARRRVASGDAVFGPAFPARTIAVRHWLRSPAGALSGLMFVPSTNRQRGISRAGGRHRVRRVGAPGAGASASVVAGPTRRESRAVGPTILNNRT